MVRGQALQIPVHGSQLVGLVNLQLEAKLDNPLHLVELVVVRPGRDGERKAWLRGHRGFDEWWLMGEWLERDVKLFSL